MRTAGQFVGFIVALIGIGLHRLGLATAGKATAESGARLVERLAR